MSKSQQFDFLRKLRVSVLLSGEKSPDKWWSSRGLSADGQTDLSAVFQRSHFTAAVMHASELAKAHHDARTRAVGVYHLFRLPTDIESSIHRSLLAAEQNGELSTFSETSCWSELEETDAKESPVGEGPVDLGSIDLTEPSDLAKLEYAYKNAFQASVSCIPYFQLTR